MRQQLCADRGSSRVQWGRVGYPRRAPMLRVSTSGLIAVKSSKIASHSALVNAEGYDSCRRGNRVGTARKTGKSASASVASAVRAARRRMAIGFAGDRSPIRRAHDA